MSKLQAIATIVSALAVVYIALMTCAGVIIIFKWFFTAIGVN